MIVQYRKLRRNKPPELQTVAINNATNPEDKANFVREAMIDHAVWSKGVSGILRMMSEQRGA